MTSNKTEWYNSFLNLTILDFSSVGLFLWAYSSVGSASVSLLCPTELWAFKWGVCRLVAQPSYAPKYGPIAQLGERSVRIREVKGSNPSRSTFSSSVILTLLLFFCVHISHTLALRSGRIRTALPCCRQGKLPARFPEPSAGEARPSLFSVSLQGLLFFIQ